MPKKLKSETPNEQSARFRAEVERMIEAGELNPTDADEQFERAMAGIRRPSTPPIDDCGD